MMIVPFMNAGEIKVGTKAPDFTLQTHDGKSLTLSKLEGKRGAVLVFFATWCPACMAEVPEVIKLTNSLRDKNVLVYGVNLRQSQRIVDRFVEDRGVNYRILLDSDGTVGNDYGIVGIPTVVAIDGNGIIRYFDHGIPADHDALAKQLNEGIQKEEVKNPHDYIKDGVSYISKETLQKLIVEKGDKLQIIDVLSPESYKNAHVKGAINIPLGELEAKRKLIDKNKTIVVYCANFRCHASTMAAEKLTALGFKDVHDYKGGIKEWKEAGLPLGK